MVAENLQADIDGLWGSNKTRKAIELVLSVPVRAQVTTNKVPNDRVDSVSGGMIGGRHLLCHSCQGINPTSLYGLVLSAQFINTILELFSDLALLTGFIGL